MNKLPKDYAQVKFRPGTGSNIEKTLTLRSPAQSDSAFSQTAKSDLSDYYELLPLCLPKFSEEEWTILFQALNGWEATPKTAHFLWAEVDEFLVPLKNQHFIHAIGHTLGRVDDLSEPIGIEYEEFLTRLRNLTVFECWTIYNALHYGTE